PGLQQTSDEVIAQGRKDPRLVGLFSLYRARTPQLYVDIDRTKCETLDLSMDEVFKTLQVYMGGAYVNLFNKFGRTWQVNLQADHDFRTSAATIAQLNVRKRQRHMVPLGTEAQIRDQPPPGPAIHYTMNAPAPANA